MIVCGRQFTPELLTRLSQEGAGLSRRALSRRLCEWLDWKGPSDRWQTTNARIALNRLQRAGLIELPKVANPFVNASHPNPPPVPSMAHLPAIKGNLEQIGSVELVLVGPPRSQVGRECRQLLQAFHPLGSHLCGAQLRYLITCPKGVLGVLCFSAAARRLEPRDRWIGWNDIARGENLHWVVNNSRFLIRDGVQVPNLASHVLAGALRRLPQDWQARYGYRPVLVETFVEKGRHHGISYKASNWVKLSQLTAGRGRNDAQRCAQKTPKHIFLYPLTKEARATLCQLPSRPRLVRPAPPPPPPRAEPADWAEEEWAEADLKDERLRKRLLILGRDFYARPQANLPQCCNGNQARTKAAYRFFEHPDVTMDAILQSHYQSTARRMAGEAVVLVPQDTTFLNYNSHPATENLGPIGTTVDGTIGLVVHDSMAFNLEGTPLGLLDVQCWARDPEQFGKKHQRKKLAFEQKESVKWRRSLEALERIQARCPQTQIVSVGDREADIYELFAWAQEPGRPGLLVRAQQNRCTLEEHGYLWEQMASQPVAGIKAVGLSRRPGRPARVAQLEVRFAAVDLKAPRRSPKLPNVRLWAVWARETDEPEGVKPVEWMLLSTLPVESFEQAKEKIQWYVGRWGIEVFHRTLKSGCKIENRQLGSADRIEACLAIDMVVAWRIFHLTKLGRETPDVPCTVFFEEAQWKALVGFISKDPIPPSEPPSLREAIRKVASLGGFLGRKGDGEPGTQTIWLGLQRLDDISEAWSVFSQMFAEQIRQTVSSNRDYG